MYRYILLISSILSVTLHILFRYTVLIPSLMSASLHISFRYTVLIHTILHLSSFSPFKTWSITTSSNVAKNNRFTELHYDHNILHICRTLSRVSHLHLKDAMSTFTICVTSSFDFGIGSNSLKNPNVKFNTYLQMFVECKLLKTFATLRYYLRQASRVSSYWKFWTMTFLSSWSRQSGVRCSTGDTRYLFESAAVYAESYNLFRWFWKRRYPTILTYTFYSRKVEFMYRQIKKKKDEI